MSSTISDDGCCCSVWAEDGWEQCVSEMCCQRPECWVSRSGLVDTLLHCWHCWCHEAAAAGVQVSCCHSQWSPPAPGADISVVMTHTITWSHRKQWEVMTREPWSGTVSDLDTMWQGRISHVVASITASASDILRNISWTLLLLLQMNDNDWPLPFEWILNVKEN